MQRPEKLVPPKREEMGVIEADFPLLFQEKNRRVQEENRKDHGSLLACPEREGRGQGAVETPEGCCLHRQGVQTDRPLGMDTFYLWKSIQAMLKEVRE